MKRRVYDALNVLIAADILRKEGKLVSCDESVANIGKKSYFRFDSVGASRRKKMKEEKDTLQKDIVTFFVLTNSLSMKLEREIEQRLSNFRSWSSKAWPLST